MPPSIREEAIKRIEKKRGEIASLEMQIREASSYIQALEEMLKLLPKDASSDGESSAQLLRPGSVVARAREAIINAGKPLHINEILTALGKPSDNTTRAGVSGSISAYYRKGEVFTRPAPNTFGLFELADKPQGQTKPRNRTHAGPVPPSNFGLDLDEHEFDDDQSLGEETVTG